MNARSPLQRLVLSALLILIPLHAKANDKILIEYVAPSLDKAYVMGVVRQALTDRQWTIAGESEASVIGKLSHNHYDATITIYLAVGALRYREQVVMTIISDHGIAKTSAEIPERWVRFLRSDISRALARVPQVSRGTPPGVPTQSAIQRLSELKGLLDAGLITQTEYEVKKAEILRGL
jgi:hypothetical protein